MSARSIAERYAAPLHALAREAECVDAVATALSELGAAFGESRTLRAALANEGIPEAKRLELAKAFATHVGAPELVHRLVHMLAGRGRLGVLPSISEAFLRHEDRRLDRLRATAHFATEPSAEALAQLKQSIEQATGKSVVLQTEVQPSLLAGFRLEIGAHTLDASLKDALGRLKRELLTGFEHRLHAPAQAS